LFRYWSWIWFSTAREAHGYPRNRKIAGRAEKVVIGFTGVEGLTSIEQNGEVRLRGDARKSTI
jgi:hypothetical protein